MRRSWLVALAALCFLFGALRGSSMLLHGHEGGPVHVHLLPAEARHDASEAHAEVHHAHGGVLAREEAEHGAEREDRDARNQSPCEDLHVCVAFPMFELGCALRTPRVSRAEPCNRSGPASVACADEQFRSATSTACTALLRPPPPKCRGGVRGLLLTSRAILV